jgi:hypothetical protein
MIQIPTSLRTVAARQGYNLFVVSDPEMPIEACRIGSRLLAMNFDTLDRLVAWLDGNDRAAAVDTRPVVAPQLVSVPRPDGTSGYLPADDVRALTGHLDDEARRDENRWTFGTIADMHAEAGEINRIKHWQTIRDRMPAHLRHDDSAVLGALRMHAVAEDRRRAARRALRIALDQVASEVDGKPLPDDPCADGCSNPAMHAEGGHDV